MAQAASRSLVRIPSIKPKYHHGNQKQSHEHQPVLVKHETDARVPHELVLVLPLFLCVVWYRAPDGRRARRVIADEGTDWEYDHRLRGDYDSGSAVYRVAVRPHRAPA